MSKIRLFAILSMCLLPACNESDDFRTSLDTDKDGIEDIKDACPLNPIIATEEEKIIARAAVLCSRTVIVMTLANAIILASVDAGSKILTRMATACPTAKTSARAIQRKLRKASVDVVSRILTRMATEC